MVETKLFEVRDSMTMIPVLAIRMSSENSEQFRLLRHVGFDPRSPRPGVVVMVLNDQKATSDAYEWSAKTGGTRTMATAHIYIEEHFEELRDGDVVDVEFILGETSEKKRPDWSWFFC